MFKRPEKEITEIAEKTIAKCSFCKIRNSVGKVAGNYYCADNSCANKLWDGKRIWRKEKSKKYGINP